jgi:hypothetical protein
MWGCGAVGPQSHFRGQILSPGSSQGFKVARARGSGTSQKEGVQIEANYRDFAILAQDGFMPSSEATRPPLHNVMGAAKAISLGTGVAMADTGPNHTSSATDSP